jgi:hypothetical protein
MAAKPETNMMKMTKATSPLVVLLNAKWDTVLDFK